MSVARRLRRRRSENEDSAACTARSRNDATVILNVF
jgi:hypothetical protein